MYAIVDIETTGLRPACDKIIEVAVIITDGEKIIDEFCTLVHPECRLPQYIMSLTSISDSMLFEAPKFYQVAKQLVTLLKDCTIVAHNARFDYSFLKKEFGELGYNLHRPVLCTVRLARELLPGLPNYRLGTICQELGINIQGAHRALADAKATAELFKLLQTKGRDFVPSLLPAGLSRDDIIALPEATGIYTFYNDAGEIVYIGKSKNIRKRVSSHFMPDHKSYKPVFYKNSVSKIGYEIVGSELFSLLRESEEIKKNLPPLNRIGKRLSDSIGVFLDTSASHYTLQIKQTKKSEQQPVMSFSNIKSAKRRLGFLAAEHGLCERFFDGLRFDVCPSCGIQGCRELAAAPALHNRAMTMALKPYRFPAETCLIEEDGPNEQSRTLIVVHKNEYLGSLVLSESSQVENFEELMNQIKRPALRLVDAREIIVSYLTQNSGAFMRSTVPFESSEKDGKVTQALYFKSKKYSA